MERYRSEISRMLFDHKYPPASWVYTRYTRHKHSDLSDKSGLMGEDIADAVLQLKDEQALILPEKTYFGGKPYKSKKSGTIVPLDTSPRFRKLGPSIDIVKSGITIKEIKEKKPTPRKAFREALSDPETRGNMKNGLYRGFGYWSPRARRHNIIWFDVPAEGQAYFSILKDKFGTEFQSADAYQSVPSFGQIDGVRFQGIRVLPVTKGEGEYFVEWLEENVTCTCKDSFFMGAKSKKKEVGEFQNVYKYANPEQVVCRHNWAQRLLAEEDGQKPGNTPLLVKWPRATGFMDPWEKIKTQVYIKDGTGLRRPLKSEVGIFCQYVLGTLEPEEAFDMTE
jgi:hypothetical protein